MRLIIETNASELAKRLDGALPVVMRHVDRKLERGAHEFAREWKRRAPKATSLLTNAIRVDRAGEASFIISAPVAHAVYTEEGTGPGGNPSQQTMLDWIRVKHISPRDPSMDEDDLAFVIRRAIRRRGTPEKPAMAETLAAKRDRLGELVEKAVQDGLKEVMGE